MLTVLKSETTIGKVSATVKIKPAAGATLTIAKFNFGEGDPINGVIAADGLSATADYTYVAAGDHSINVELTYGQTVVEKIDNTNCSAKLTVVKATTIVSTGSSMTNLFGGAGSIAAAGMFMHRRRTLRNLN